MLSNVGLEASGAEARDRTSMLNSRNPRFNNSMKKIRTTYSSVMFALEVLKAMWSTRPANQWQWCGAAALEMRGAIPAFAHKTWEGHFSTQRMSKHDTCMVCSATMCVLHGPQVFVAAICVLGSQSSPWGCTG